MGRTDILLLPAGAAFHLSAAGRPQSSSPGHECWRNTGRPCSRDHACPGHRGLPVLHRVLTDGSLVAGSTVGIDTGPWGWRGWAPSSAEVSAPRSACSSVPVWRPEPVSAAEEAGLTGPGCWFMVGPQPLEAGLRRPGEPPSAREAPLPAVGCLQCSAGWRDDLASACGSWWLPGQRCPGLAA